MKALSTDSLLARMLAQTGGGGYSVIRAGLFVRNWRCLLPSIAGHCRVAAIRHEPDDLVGPNLKDHQNLLAVQKEFPQQGNDLVVVVESEDTEKNRQFVERLAMKMAPETNLFHDIFYQQNLAMMGTKALVFRSDERSGRDSNDAP